MSNFNKKIIVFLKSILNKFKKNKKVEDVNLNEYISEDYGEWNPKN